MQRCLILIACLALGSCSNPDTQTTAGQTAVAVLRFNADGKPDTTFGAGTGGAIIDPAPGLFDFALAVALQADGKILSTGGTVVAGQNVVVLIRQNADGSLDTTFGTGGIVTTPVGAGTSGTGAAIAVQPADQKIVVAAVTFTQTTGTISLLRYMPNGALDSTFGNAGLVSAPIGPGLDGDTCGLALQGANIVVAGGSSDGNVTLFRFLGTNGAPDNTFGPNNNGVTTTQLGAPAMSPSIALQTADNKIVLAGGKGSFDSSFTGPIDQVVIRYTADGALDTTFNGTGIVTTDIDLRANFGNVPLVQADGKIVVVGHANVSFAFDTSDISLVRYKADGTPDTTFGTRGDGIVVTDLVGRFDNALGIALDGSGNFVVSGNSGAQGVATTIVLRYDATGKLDNTFGGNGLVAPAPRGPSFISSGNAVVVQPADGKIVVAGYD